MAGFHPYQLQQLRKSLEECLKEDHSLQILLAWFRHLIGVTERALVSQGKIAWFYSLCSYGMHDNSHLDEVVVVLEHGSIPISFTRLSKHQNVFSRKFRWSYSLNRCIVDAAIADSYDMHRLQKQVHSRVAYSEAYLGKLSQHSSNISTIMEPLRDDESECVHFVPVSVLPLLTVSEQALKSLLFLKDEEGNGTTKAFQQIVYLFLETESISSRTDGYLLSVIKSCLHVMFNIGKKFDQESINLMQDSCYQFMQMLNEYFSVGFQQIENNKIFKSVIYAFISSLNRSSHTVDPAVDTIYVNQLKSRVQSAVNMFACAAIEAGNAKLCNEIAICWCNKMGFNDIFSSLTIPVDLSEISRVATTISPIGYAALTGKILELSIFMDILKDKVESWQYKCVQLVIMGHLLTVSYQSRGPSICFIENVVFSHIKVYPNVNAVISHANRRNRFAAVRAMLQTEIWKFCEQKFSFSDLVNLLKVLNLSAGYHQWDMVLQLMCLFLLHADEDTLKTVTCYPFLHVASWYHKDDILSE